ncbi:hypothetical protein PARPLA_00024 [Rhodobacteraceae bacterium THAF1]|uniref:histidine phosphatase family protein n=1 Tax=Palleronia sp. THAF1 TaxID=2587842 RepID=UPI000F40017B|nr:histidine phosphatase family protein [Palleronia sp. THAF1]QFU07160.1 hypothetical protein FIU81_00515 [Palleronia sp. THAF1]VDC16685.1 hypothetical protein PARPLA_00024 [Rhodobacteraceae bacterium THAF1]
MFRFTLSAAILALTAGAAFADPDIDAVEPVTKFVGEMAVPMPGGGIDKSAIENSLRFEPLQNFDDMFLRDDVVFLMRHGPTDWSKLDKKEVAPTDCDNQRIMSEQGREDMRNLGALLAFNDIVFGKIVVSEWCRNQQTYDELKAGYDRVDPGVWSSIPAETVSDLNLLLSLQGARNVTVMRDMISTWGEEEVDGPLLIISHFTNIQELTEFAVYEGEMLIMDPDRRNRVLGYLRLRTANPDVGHFDTETQNAVYNEDGSLNEVAAEASGAIVAGEEADDVLEESDSAN